MTALPLVSKDAPRLRPLTFTPVEGIQEGRLRVGPSLASQILTDHNYERQRPLRPGHVAELAALMRRKAFLPGSQIAFARVGKRLFLINGQHRLSAVVESGREVEFQVMIVNCRNEEDVARHYYTFDRLVTARSDGDVIKAVRICETHGISHMMARGVWQAVPIIEHRFARIDYQNDPERRDDDRRLGMCEPWWGYAAELDAILRRAPSSVRQRLLSAQTVSVALVLLRDQPEGARAFLSGIAEDDGLRRDDPRKAFLIDMAARAWRRKSLDGSLTMAYAWNAYFLRRPLSQLRVLQNSRFRLEGTAFDGRR
jgi:hypothetical protein